MAYIIGTLLFILFIIAKYKWFLGLGLIVLIISLVLRYLEQVFWLTMWPLALLLYLVYFLLLPVLILNKYLHNALIEFP